MYEVAVLAAGSPKALKKWMNENGFRYPDGMDKVCNEYIDQSWCFVAVKTKVGQKKGVDPRPGQRTVKSKLPTGSTFDDVDMTYYLYYGDPAATDPPAHWADSMAGTSRVYLAADDF